MFSKSLSSTLLAFFMILVAFTGCIEDPGLEPVENGGEKPEDTYACEINSEGYCIFTGTPHQKGLEPGTDNIIDREGNYFFGIDSLIAVNSEGTILQAGGTPAFDGDQLFQSSPGHQESLSKDEKAFHKVMAIMFPIRNALMYDIESVTQDEWNALVNELEIREIKETTFTDGQTPKDNYYGRQGIFDLAKDPNGKDIHHDVMKFLEESGLYLLCHVTSDDFTQMLADTHPEGHNPCKDAGITTKIPFVEDTENNTTQDYNMTVTEVIDGDTFYLGNGDKIRMLGINTPESGRPYSQEATDFLTNMILGKEVTLVNDSKNGDSDSYGRLLAHVYVNDTFVNYEIIKVGFAFWYPYTSGTDFDVEYEAAQVHASNNRVGLWTESSYNLTIDYIEYDPEGDEAEGEYVVLTNHENYNVSMVGWFLQDEAAQTAYEFNFTIMNNTSIRIYTGDGVDNSTTLFWGWYQGIWNNGGDFAILQDENGYMVDSYRYD
jgi:endonuclease YncB( thermonuclease family)